MGLVACKVVVKICAIVRRFKHVILFGNIFIVEFKRTSDAILYYKYNIVSVNIFIILVSPD
jgi:hypothetical protein